MKLNPEKKDAFIKQAGILAMAGIFCRIIGLLYRSPLMYIIGATGNGYYSFAYNIYVMVLLIASYSIPSAVSKEMSQKIALREYKNAQRIFRCVLVYVVIVGILGSSFTFIFAEKLVPHNSAFVLRIFAPTIFFSGLLGAFRGYFQAHKTMVESSISQVIEQIVNAVASLGAAYLFIQMVANESKNLRAIYGAKGSALGTGLGVVSALIFMVGMYLYNKKDITQRVKADDVSVKVPYYRIFQRMLLTITPIIICTFLYNFSTILNGSILSAILMKQGMTEKTISTLYGVFTGKSVVVATIPIAIATSMAAALIPSISGEYVKGNVDETKKRINRAIKTIMMIAIPSAIGLLVLTRQVINALFPDGSFVETATIYLRVICITVIFYSLSTLTNAILQAIGKVNAPVVNAGIALVIQTAVVVGLLLANGKIMALAVGSIIYSFLMTWLNSRSLKKEMGYQMEIKNFFVKPIIAALIMGFVEKLIYEVVNRGLVHFVFHMDRTNFATNLIALILSIGISVCVYFTVLVKTKGLTKEEVLELPKGRLLAKFMA